MYLRRWLVFSAIALTFFVAALSNDVYNLTSPVTLTWHVALRKFYSIIAFALVGGAFMWASGANIRTTSLAIAAYSAAIEIGQHFSYGREPIVWNVVDVVCGGIGGALAGVIPWSRAREGARISAAQMRRRIPPV